MTSQISARQQQILDCIYEEVNTKGYPPTVREICEAVDLSSTSTVHGHLEKLEKNGYIVRDSSKPRAIEVTSKALDLLDIDRFTDKIPMVGVVTAGNPITAIEETRDFFPVPDNLMNENEALFMLTIRGNSMINAGILDGDQVIVRKQTTASNGEIVIAMTEEDEATCKRFYKEDEFIRLEPENEEMEALLFDNVSILGKVIGLYRPNIY
ncbi:MAG: transcriptional repressor LexA [Atopococcus tabaci]|uniref:LexA repressor n=1 Tax=Atopococcus tabaci TaxID=269774 RepID=A0AA43U735_9LACT|nr:transcriptional repressor LexA [Atopococcus tabaci]